MDEGTHKIQFDEDNDDIIWRFDTPDEGEYDTEPITVTHPNSRRKYVMYPDGRIEEVDYDG
jgi:hypothetical protein